MATEQFVIRLGVNSTGVVAGINSAVGQFQRLYNRTTNILAGIGVGNYLKGIIDWAGHLNDLSIQMGVSTEALQAWEYAAKQTGVQVDDVAIAFKKFQKAQVDAIQGNRDATEAFRRSGQTISQLRRLDPSEAFRRTGEAMGKLGASAQTTSDAMTLFGKNGPVMLAAFRDGFGESAENAQKLGLIIEDSIIQRLDSFGDKMGMLGKKMMASLAPPLATLAGWLDKAISKVTTAIIGGSTYLGALSGGASKKDAYAMAIQAGLENEKQQKKDEENLQKQIEANKHKKSLTPEQTDTKPKFEKSFDPSTDSLARLGGYRGGSGELARIPQAQLTELQSLNRQVQRLVTVTERKPSVSPEAQQLIRGLQSMARILGGQGE